MSSGGYTAPDPTPGTGGCSRVDFVTVLASVQPAQLARVSPGDVCAVSLEGVAPSLQIRVRLDDGSLLGAVVERWAEMVECLRAGYDFTAEVVTAHAPVRVRVRAA